MIEVRISLSSYIALHPRI